MNLIEFNNCFDHACDKSARGLVGKTSVLELEGAGSNPVQSTTFNFDS